MSNGLNRQVNLPCDTHVSATRRVSMRQPHLSNVDTMTEFKVCGMLSQGFEQLLEAVYFCDIAPLVTTIGWDQTHVDSI